MPAQNFKHYTIMPPQFQERMKGNFTIKVPDGETALEQAYVMLASAGMSVYAHHDHAASLFGRCYTDNPEV